jgi:hypothetical protein
MRLVLNMLNDNDYLTYSVYGNEISCKWDNDEKIVNRRALREMQQKRLMNSSLFTPLHI